MARLVLGKTPEQLRAEEAEKQREIEAQIQEATRQRQEKIEALHKKQKTTKIAVIATVSAVSAILLVFGTYNTFFKKTLTLEDVQPSINSSINSLNFPSEGLDNYIRENCEPLFMKYMTYDLKNSNIQSVEVDKNSCYVSRVKKLNATLAQVYFSVDVIVHENDKEVTDPKIIDSLKKSGLLSNTPQSTQTTEPTDSSVETTDSSTDSNTESTTTTEPVESSTEPNSNVESSTDPNPENSAANSENPSNNSGSPTADAPTAGTPTGVANAEDGGYSSNTSDTSSSQISLDQYYLGDKGKIMQKGSISTVRYNFYVPIEFYYVYSGGYDEETGKPIGSVVAGGFRPAGDMTLFTLEQPDVKTFDEIAYNSAFICDEETILGEETTRQIQVKVDKTLSDLYEGRDTSQDFYNYRKFNGFNAEYAGITELKSYSQKNAFGMNTHVTYSIKTSQGFIYTLETWMDVEQDGNSWVIKEML